MAVHPGGEPMTLDAHNDDVAREENITWLV